MLDVLIESNRCGCKSCGHLLHLHYTARNLHRYHARVCAGGLWLRIWCDISRTIENVFILLCLKILSIGFLVLH